MPKRDSPPDMVGGSRRPCSCGWDIPPTDSPYWYLDEWAVLHTAHHRGHARPHTFQQWKEYAEALAAAVGMLEASRGRYRSRIVDLEEQVKDLAFDLKVADEVVDDLKADLAACQEGRDV